MQASFSITCFDLHWQNHFGCKWLMFVLCLSLSENTAAPSPAVCYYILLSCQHSAAQQVVICLLATTETNLEVFRPELTQFCEMLATHIPSTKVVNQACIIKPCMPFINKKKMPPPRH